MIEKIPRGILYYTPVPWWRSRVSLPFFARQARDGTAIFTGFTFRRSFVGILRLTK